MTAIILGISTILQFIAAYLSVRLIQITGKWKAWTLFAVAMTLMGIRRSISFYHTLTGDTVRSSDLSAEIIALTISILMITAVLLIAPIFRTIQLANVEIRRSEEKYKEAINFLPQAICESNLQGEVLFTNQAGRELFGDIDKQNSKKTRLQDLVIQENRERGSANIQKILAGATIGPNEYTIIRKNGSTFPALLYSGPIMNAGEVCGIRSLIIDISERKQAEEKLKKSEEKHREVVNFLPQIILETDLHGKTVFSNTAGYEAFGELAGTADGVVPEDRIRASDNIKRALQGETIGPNEYNLLRKDGSTFPALVYSGPIMTTGEISGIRSLIIDISERKRAEEELSKSEANLREAQRIAHLGFWELDINNDDLFWSDEVYSIFGQQRDSFELTRDSIRKMVHTEDRLRVENAINRTLREDTPHVNEYRIVLESGEIRYIHSIGEIVHDESGSPIRMFGTLHDITDRKLAEEKLEKSEEKFREMVNFLPQPIYEADLQGYINFTNHAGFEAFGELPEAIDEKRNILDFVVPEDREDGKNNMQNILQGETKGATEYTMLRKDGSTFPALVYSAPIMNTDRISGIRGLIIDITELEKVTGNLKKSEMKLKEAQRIAGIGSWEWSYVTNKLVDCSQEYARILGFTVAEMHTTYASNLEDQKMIHPEDLDRYNQAEFDAQDKHEGLNVEYRIITPGKAVRHVHELSEFELDGNGEIVNSYGTLQDITERRQAEAELKNSEQKYRTLVESSPFCIHQIDDNGHLISMNHAGLQMLDIEDESDIIGMPYLDSVSQSDQERISNLMDAALAGEYTEFEFRSPEGLEFRSNFVPIFNTDKKVSRLLGITQDVTEQKRAEQALIENEASFRGIFEQAAVGVALFNAKTGKMLRINQYFCDMLGYSSEEISRLESFHKITHPDDLQEDLDNTAKLLNGEVREFTMDKRYIHKNGSIVWANLTVSSNSNLEEGPEPDNYIAAVQNITARRLADEELRKLSRGVEASSTSVIITDLGGIIEYVNPNFTEITGYTKDEAIGRHLSILRSQETPDSTFVELWETVHAGGVWKGELHDKKKDGTLFWARISITGVKDTQGNITHVISNQEDVTHEYELSEQLSYQATHDALTGLVNRGEFERRAERLLSTVRQEQAEHALCYMDLDQFKVVNDTCGHTAGDEMMRQLSSILQAAVRKRDTLARLGGDEFGVLMEHCSPDHAHRVASNLQQVIQDYQFVWEDHVFKVGVSIGLVAINETFPNLTELLKQADAACYMAKDLGRNRIHVYHGEDASLAQRHGEMQWVTRIYQALKQNRFCLYAQTIVPLNNSQDRHYELLLRMKDETGQLIPPGAFLPAAERYNLIEQLDAWVIENAFTLLAANPVFLKQVHFVSINLSGQSLAKSSFLDIIVAALDRTAIEANKICFEITETTAITNLSAASTFISTLKALGCQFALDDFGSGLSSFGYLKNLSVDYLKIDGMFVKDIVEDPIDRAMVKSINEIGHVMGMQTIAEFVENDEIKGMLREIGVNYAQGYGIGKPQPFAEILQRSANVTNISGDLYLG